MYVVSEEDRRRVEVVLDVAINSYSTHIHIFLTWSQTLTAYSLAQSSRFCAQVSPNSTFLWSLMTIFCAFDETRRVFFCLPVDKTLILWKLQCQELIQMKWSLSLFILWWIPLIQIKNSVHPRCLSSSSANGRQENMKEPARASFIQEEKHRGEKWLAFH